MVDSHFCSPAWSILRVYYIYSIRKGFCFKSGICNSLCGFARCSDFAVDLLFFSQERSSDLSRGGMCIGCGRFSVVSGGVSLWYGCLFLRVFDIDAVGRKFKAVGIDMGHGATASFRAFPGESCASALNFEVCRHCS